ncbi:hypothetical protein ScalyP_jg5269 [Parmales sp. scaly parma]|nr:hypothetical protein ScalyP_jg5269 [Parmales sp. scaly parma]
MPAYHSKNDDSNCATACGMAFMPMKTAVKGPAVPLEQSDSPDIIDEAISTFRANVLFKNFEVKGGADRTLIYLTLYIQLAMGACEKVKTKKEAKTALYQLAIKSFTIPGDAGWSLGGMFPPPESRDETESLKAYIKQARTECSERLLDRFYNEDGTQNKWWMSFSKRKFMGKALSA